jgi:hypothetical protein
MEATYGDAEAPPPAVEHEKFLSSRLQEAEQRVAAGRRMVDEWLPIAKSCAAGLQALEAARHPQDEGPSPSY